MGINHEHRDLVVIVPTRGRPHNALALKEAFYDTEANSDLVFVVDFDDPMIEEYQNLPIDILTYEREGKGMAAPLNKAARELLACCQGGYKYFAFMGDDHRPRTMKWDSEIIKHLADLHPSGIVYGNDLLQGANLPTAVFMTRNIVEVLDGMVPPTMKHLYLDDFWLHLGHSIKSIRYLENVIIEHLHPIAGKAAMDAGYAEVNASDISSHDHQAFNDYIRSEPYYDAIYRLS